MFPPISKLVLSFFYLSISHQKNFSPTFRGIFRGIFHHSIPYHVLANRISQTSKRFPTTSINGRTGSARSRGFRLWRVENRGTNKTDRSINTFRNSAFRSLSVNNSPPSKNGIGNPVEIGLRYLKWRKSNLTAETADGCDEVTVRIDVFDSVSNGFVNLVKQRSRSTDKLRQLCNFRR